MEQIIQKLKTLPEEPVFLVVIAVLLFLTFLYFIKTSVWKRRFYRFQEQTIEERNKYKDMQKTIRTEMAAEEAVHQKKVSELQRNIESLGHDYSDMMRITAQRTEEANAAQTRADAVAKRLETLQRQFQKNKGLLDSAFSSLTVYASSAPRSEEALRVILETVNTEFEAVIPADLKAMTIKDLRARFKQNARQIQELCQLYQDKYTTKTNTTIYRLLVLALEEGVQNIYHSLSFGKLDTAIARFRQLTSKCYEIAIEGNQTIITTLSRFIGQAEYLYIEAIKIEHEYYVQLERAKEEQRAIREQIRQELEENRALEQQRKQVENEERKYHSEIARLQEQVRTSTESQTIAVLQQRLAEVEAMLSQVEENKERIINLQNGKAGTVYIISNLGAFGEKMFKIGMTRRLEPMDRVRELGDASVPFPFDVHSLVFSEDAVSLEYALHKELARQRINKVNLRKEFFGIEIDDLEALVNRLDPTAPFERTMLAEQYHQSLSIDVPPEEGAIDMISDDGVIEEEVFNDADIS